MRSNPGIFSDSTLVALGCVATPDHESILQSVDGATINNKMADLSGYPLPKARRRVREAFS